MYSTCWLIKMNWWFKGRTQSVMIYFATFPVLLFPTALPWTGSSAEHKCMHTFMLTHRGVSCGGRWCCVFLGWGGGSYSLSTCVCVCCVLVLNRVQSRRSDKGLFHVVSVRAGIQEETVAGLSHDTGFSSQTGCQTKPRLILFLNTFSREQ